MNNSNSTERCVSFSTNPYQSLEEHQFWKTGVVDQGEDEIFSGLWNPKFPISKDAKIITVGSCFAQHISRWLKSNGYMWLECEQPPEGTSATEIENQGYGVFSFRTGNIYTAALLRQWIALAINPDFEIEEVFQESGRFFDPLRPTIPKNGYTSIEELKQARQKTLEGILLIIKSADVFIFTLGLTETWINKNGYVYPVCPGTIRGCFNKDEHVLENYSYDLILEDMLWTIENIKEINPRVKFILTVSPVPLTATATNQHILTANTYSKSVLRAVAGMLATNLADVDYFPSYELISSSTMRGKYYEDNLRSVKPAGVEFVMEHFNTSIGIKKSGLKDKATKSATNNEICEDVLLESWNRNRANKINAKICLIGDSQMGKLSMAFNSIGINHYGGMIMNGSAWTSDLLHLDDEDIMVPLENSDARLRWQETLGFFKQQNNNKLVITNIGMQTHRSVSYFIEYLNEKNISTVTPQIFIDYFHEKNKLKLDIINHLIRIGEKVLVVSDPPTQKMNSDLTNIIQVWDIYDEYSLMVFDYYGCLTFNARSYFGDANFKESYYSREWLNDKERDWYHGSDEYYQALANALIEKGFIT